VADAASLNDLANDLKDAGRYAEAEQAYRRAIEADAAWSVPWYNLGLLYKILRRWDESARCNRRATELDPADGDAWWNLGIAATALGEWALARAAWRGCGIAMPDGDGPPRMGYGPVPVRLNPEGDGEVVWCDRIDPARAVIRNVPLPESGHREGDLLLHDGAPNGYRLLGGRRVPVFDELQLLERSDRSTFEAWVTVETEHDLDALRSLADEAGVAVEVWSETVRRLCKQCSEGVPHETHDPAPPDAGPRRRVGLAARGAHEAQTLLAQWESAARGRRVLELSQVL
jgi:tetratricopeptide (TPR) repeat protein